MNTRIVIVRLSALGDVVLVLAAARAALQQHPDIHLTWVIGRSAYELVKNETGIEFIVIDKPSRLRDYWHFWQQMRSHRFDVLLEMQASLRANFLYPLIRAGQKIGFDSVRARDHQHWFSGSQIPHKKQHLVDSFMSFFDKAGVGADAPVWGLEIDESARDWVQRMLSARTGPVVAVCFAASKAERNWHQDRYILLINRLVEDFNCSVVLLGELSAQKIADQILVETKTSLVNLVGRTSLPQLVAICGESDCLVSPDSGPVHIATSLGTPVVGLYAVAPSWLTGPYRSEELTVDCYDEAVEKILGKNPEKVSWGTRVHSKKAMDLITVDAVLEKLDQALKDL